MSMGGEPVCMEEDTKDRIAEVFVRLPSPSRKSSRRSMGSSRSEGSPTNSPKASHMAKTYSATNFTDFGVCAVRQAPSQEFLRLDTDPPYSPKWVEATSLRTYRWVALSVSSVLALILCGAVAAMMRQLEHPAAAPQEPVPPAPAGPIWASALFDSKELHQAAIDTLMRVGHNYLTPAHRRKVSAVVEDNFRTTARSIKGKVDVQLDAAQKDAIVAAMRLMSDARVQSIGLDVALAIQAYSVEQPLVRRQAVAKQAMIHRIAEKLRPRMQEIEQLDEIIPAPLRTLREGHRWELTFDPSNIHAASTVNGPWELAVGLQSQPKEGQEPLPAQKRSLSIRGGAYQGAVEAVALLPASAASSLPSRSAAPRLVDRSGVPDDEIGLLAGAMEEVRFLLRILKLDTNLAQDPFAGSWELSARAVVSCDMTDQTQHHPNLLQALVCPLKFGVMGLDVL